MKNILMVKYAEEQASMQQHDERMQQQVIQNYQIIHEELIGLCEEYWTILRSESFLFCHLPQRMFKDNPRLVQELKRMFILILICVSEIGFLCSNEEFIFNETYLKEQLQCCNSGFLILMRVLLYKLTPEMLQTYFWARKLKEIIDQKIKLEMSGKKIEPKMSPQEAVKELLELNNESERAIQSLLVEIQLIQEGKSKQKLQDVQKFDHSLFPTIQETLGNIGTLSFKDACTLIGRSLVSEFSEIDSNESGNQEQDAY